MIRLEKRPQVSAVMTYATPLLAVLATFVAGGVLFDILGKDPVQSIITIFYEPLFGEFSFFYRPLLLIKGAPLILIAIGLALGFRAGIWNIGAEGQYIVGAICGAGAGLAFYPLEAPWIFPLMILAGALGEDPGGSESPVRHKRNSGISDAGIRRRTTACFYVLGFAEKSRRVRVSRLAQLTTIPICP